MPTTKIWNEKLEFIFPLAIALLAAALAINDLFEGKYGSDEIKLTNDRNSAYQWYQSKGIKETILEGQADLLKSMVQAGAIAATHSEAIESNIQANLKKVARYRKDKQEILVGSKALPESEWSQEVDGKLGKVTGAKEFEAAIGVLGEAGDAFDLATMLFQLSLVVGAIGIMMKKDKLRIAFFFLMCLGSVVGFAFSWKAIWLASKVTLS